MHMGVSVHAYRTNLSPCMKGMLSVFFTTLGIAVRRQCLPSPETSIGEAAQQMPAGTLAWGKMPKSEHIVVF